MKLQADPLDIQSINAVGDGWIQVGPERLTEPVALGSHGERLALAFRSVQEVDADTFTPIAALGPELVIFGSGDRLARPPAASLRPLLAQRIGIEVMDTRAACRTYNILAGEGRHVVVMLLMTGAG